VIQNTWWENINPFNTFITFPLGTKEISRLNELFLRKKYHPVANKRKTLAELLAILLDKKKNPKDYIQYNIYYITYFVLPETKENPTKTKEKPTTSGPKKKKPKGTIITVTGHGGTIHPSSHPVYHIHSVYGACIHKCPKFQRYVTHAFVKRSPPFFADN